MSEDKINTKTQKLKISKWAITSLYLSLIGLASILLSLLSVEILYNIYNVSEFLRYIVPEVLWAVGIISIILGFITSIIGLICIKASKGALKGIGRTMIGLLLGLLLIALVLSVTIIGRHAHNAYPEDTTKNNK